MDNNKIFKLICEYIQPRTQGMLDEDPVMFERRLSAVSSTIRNTLANEAKSDAIDKMVGDFEFQVRSLYSQYNTKENSTDENLIVVPKNIKKIASKTLEKHDKWPHFGTPDGLSMARVLTYFPNVTRNIVAEINDHFNSENYSEDEVSILNKNLWGGDEAKVWAQSFYPKSEIESTPETVDEIECEPTLADTIINLFKEAHEIPEEKIDKRSSKERKTEAYLKNSGFKIS